ncbi:tetratricopeptide repeat protein [Luteibacter jiangsuensis]|uniref:Tetratricopeptide repeat protein n=1 Tax=Luteibacter jiangsuensis TaxID=637577 RepID=A0ABX0Q5X7_9GAMM|nr:tetratricopeptide repeat protein [Luteibacter jiangsuensis]
MLFRLGGLLGAQGFPRAFAACVGAGAWLLHPLFVSTVLYVVQREAMLPTAFVLLGLHLWLTARSQVQRGRSEIGLLLGIPLLTLLALLSKANGILLPLLIVAVDSCVPPLASHDRRYRRLLRISCWPWILAVAAVLAWLAYRGIDNASAAYRGWTIGQRLLTEPSILWVYLGQLWLVLPTSGSVFHDQYVAATDLWHPLWTLPAILGLAVVLGMGLRYRKTHPALAMSVIFYFAGHLIESTSLPLELYFEHRNYLPGLLMFWPAALAAGRHFRARTAVAGAVILLTGMSLLSLRLVRLWNNPPAQALFWATQSPESPRAQAYAAQIEGAAGRADLGIQRLTKRQNNFPNEPQIALTLLDLRCQEGSVTGDDILNGANTLRHAARDPGRILLNWSLEAIEEAKAQRCTGLDNKAILTILDAAASNPIIASLPGRMQDIVHARGELALARGDTQSALEDFNKALALSPTPQAALEQAAALGRAGAPGLGLRHLAYFKTLPEPPGRGPSTAMAWLHDRVLERQGYWRNEIDHLNAALARDDRKRAQ